ncbi:MAG: hypothetical protein WCG26_09245 [Chloroflexales bacterium]
MAVTTDGHRYPDRLVACLIGDSLPTPALCAEAVAILTDALRVGVTREQLWSIANAAVWDGLHAARVLVSWIASDIPDIV